MKIILLIFLLTCGFAPVDQKECLKAKVNGQRFKGLSKKSIATNAYFVIKDSLHTEYVNDSIYARSKIIWIGCNNYLLIPTEVFYSDGGIEVGDTLRIKLISFRDNTLTYVASVFGYDFQLKARKF